MYVTLTDPKEKKNVLKKIRQLKVQLRKLPRKDTTDKKIAYVRYTDDFIIGVCGSRSDCEKLNELIKTYLRDKLKLELSDEKTKITHSAQKARFLGYDISVRRNNVCKRQKNGIVRRTLNNTVELAIPFENIEKFLYENKIVEQKLDSSMFP
ncbi:MAG: group II intron reverse transcriptase/maturase, partial [Bacteroidales bacterium]|nr:group II intron reverse transcriptase/maturase [Bacteroidales bacterium]